DAGGQLLHAHVDEAVVRAVGLGDLAAAHLGHAGPLQLDGVHGARDREVVAQHDRVAALLGGPAAAPLAPGGVTSEQGLDRAEVVRQVVLGQQVHEEARSDLGGEIDLVRVPLPAGLEVPAAAPGD